MGYDDPEPFNAELKRQLEVVERHYAALFEDSLDLGADGALVFTGTEDDPETLKTLSRLGFARPADAAKTVRSWHHGHIRATRTARARELLTELMPELLRALGGAGGPRCSLCPARPFHDLAAGRACSSSRYSAPIPGYCP